MYAAHTDELLTQSVTLDFGALKYPSKQADKYSIFLL